jgi:hypothetical protein
MTTVAQVWEVAQTLPHNERAELAKQLLGSLDREVSDAARYAALTSAVDVGIASLDAGEGVEIPAGGLRDFLRERGRLASERLAARSAHR